MGRHVLERLNQMGIKMTVLTRKKGASTIKHLPFVNVVQANPHDPKVLMRYLPGHTAVINLIAILHGSADEFELVHEKLPVTIANCCAQQGVKRIIHISALGADLSAPSMYLRSKARGEQALHSLEKTKELEITLLKPSVIFGLDDQFINVFAALQKSLPLIPLACANAKFQPVWVINVAHAVAYCVVHSHTAHKTFELGGPQIFTLKELVQFAGSWGKHQKAVIPLPPFASYLQALVMEHLPGKTLMSRDNLLSMRVDNVLGGRFDGLEALGVKSPKSLHSVFGVTEKK